MTQAPLLDTTEAGGAYFYINCALAPDFRFGGTQIGGEEVGLEQPGVLCTTWRRCLDTSMMELGIKHALGAVKPTKTHRKPAFEVLYTGRRVRAPEKMVLALG